LIKFLLTALVDIVSQLMVVSALVPSCKPYVHHKPF